MMHDRPSHLSPGRARSAWPVRGYRCGRRQRGQALVLGIFILIAGLAALFYLFNAGQLLQDKAKLVTAADAVAYSAGVMHARVLNFEAYTNRAMIANTVTIAQLVSLNSWGRYVVSLGREENTGRFPLEKYPLFYPAHLLAVASRPALIPLVGDAEAEAEAAQGIQGTDESQPASSKPKVLEVAAKAVDEVIRNVLMKAQKVAYQGLPEARQVVMDSVANANYNNDGRDGEVKVAREGGEGGEGDVALNEKRFEDFITQYDQDKRTRLAETVRAAMAKEDFVNQRDWKSAMVAVPVTECAPLPDFLRRSGGTNLLGFDEWQAIDTLSEHRWYRRKHDTFFCTGQREEPRAWGLQEARNQKSKTNQAVQTDQSAHEDPRDERTALQRSASVNPKATVLAQASSKEWNYSGLPGFYDLSEEMLKEEDPRLEFAVRVTRQISETKTAEGRSALKNTLRLNAYEAKLAGGDRLVSVSASEVYFERPPISGPNQSNDLGKPLPNEYGKDMGKPREIGSLFNPFWQVRLIDPSRYVTKAQAAQGINLP